MFQPDDAIAVLLSPGFEEGTAVYCLDRFREAGYPVSLVGMTNNPIRGVHGIAIQPDCTIDDISSDVSFRLVILSGGQQYISSMLVDPRVYNLFKETIDAQGHIATTTNTKQFLDDVGGLPSLISQSPIISQGNMSPIEFVKALLELTAVSDLVQ
ncbi:MAG: DJ-1/PfpI family protein [Chloroflexi bacterium]|nr:DJ-1/PfpI family protein [Chloroflexota bacterium]